MKRVLQAFAAALVGAAMLVAGSANAQAPEKKKVTIAVGGKNLFYYLPLAVAERQGYFKQEGLDVEIPNFAGGSQALRALVGGSADMVSGAYEHTINMVAKKQPIKAVVLLCEGTTFFSGADIGEFNGPPKEAEFRNLFGRFEKRFRNR